MSTAIRVGTSANVKSLPGMWGHQGVGLEIGQVHQIHKVLNNFNYTVFEQF